MRPTPLAAQRPGPVRRARRPVVAARRRVRRAALAGRLAGRAHPARPRAGRGAGRPGLRRRADGAARRPPGVPARRRRHRAARAGAGPRARDAPVLGSVLAVPLADGCADVVVAGEILEHVDGRRRGAGRVRPAAAPGRHAGARRARGRPAVGADQRAPARAAARRAAARAARPGAVRRPGAAARRRRPAGSRSRLVGLRPSMREAIAWKFGRRTAVRMKPIRSTAVVFAGYGRKR